MPSLGVYTVGAGLKPDSVHFELLSTRSMHIKKDGVLPMTSHSHPLAFTCRNSVGTDTNAARADGLKTSYRYMYLYTCTCGTPRLPTIYVFFSVCATNNDIQ